MINILVPMAGKSLYFPENEYPFPKPLIEIAGKTMIEHVVENLSTIDSDVRFIFIVSDTDCRKFHLDDTLSIITNQKCQIVRLQNETKGAPCSALMAAAYIDNDCPLIISNYDQIFDISMSDALSKFKGENAGVITIDSVHPRWSYIKNDENNYVIEAAEKKPISRNAIAGLFYFSAGANFVDGAKKSILKNASLDGIFYTAPILNELILKGLRVKQISIESEKYHTFYTPHKIREFEALFLEKKQSKKSL